MYKPKRSSMHLANGNDVNLAAWIHLNNMYLGDTL